MRLPPLFGRCFSHPLALSLQRVSALHRAQLFFMACTLIAVCIREPMVPVAAFYELTFFIQSLGRAYLDAVANSILRSWGWRGSSESEQCTAPDTTSGAWTPL